MATALDVATWFPGNMDRSAGDSITHLKLQKLVYYGNEPVYVALKYYDFEHECFSSWTRDELKEFSNFVGTLRKLCWANLSGGLRPKPCKVEHAQHGARERLKRVHDQLSREIQFVVAEAVSKRARAETHS